MTPNQWLLFVGVPALFAVVAIIVDWWAARRRRIDKMISRTFRPEEPRGVPGNSSDLQSGSPQSKAEQTDPWDELARVIGSTRRGGVEGDGKSQRAGVR
jgi:hypothetical protein